MRRKDLTFRWCSYYKGSTVHYCSNREEIVEVIKEVFKPTVPLRIHWDGKKFLIVSQFLYLAWNSTIACCSKDSFVTGDNMASAITTTTVDWKVTDRVKVMCFDTTSSNTGHRTWIEFWIMLERGLRRRDRLGVGKGDKNSPRIYSELESNILPISCVIGWRKIHRMLQILLCFGHWFLLTHSHLITSSWYCTVWKIPSLFYCQPMHYGN